MSFPHLSVPNLAVLGAFVAVLIVAQSAVWLLKWRRKDKDWTELAERIETWWKIAGLIILCLAVGKTASLVLIAFISFLALKEYFSLIPTRRADRRVLIWAYLAIPLQYYFVHISWYGMFIVLIPVYLFLFIPARMVTIGETKDFLRAVSTIQWGVMVTVFCISHLAYLLVLPKGDNALSQGVGLFLFLLIMTELNDVAQFLWGKSLGKHKISPTVSPKKTWEGFLGGVFTMGVLGYFLGPLLTPLIPLRGLAMGVLLSIVGFLGDITISALKRDLGVKDSGTMLPGHGGILDRVDSLTYTAPIFFHVMRYFYY